MRPFSLANLPLANITFATRDYSTFRIKVLFSIYLRRTQGFAQHVSGGRLIDVQHSIDCDLMPRK